MTIETLLSIPKSFYVSWKLTSLRQAFKLPCMIHYRSKIISLKGKLHAAEIARGVFRVGFGNVGIVDNRFETAVLEIDGNIVIKSEVQIGSGSRISIGRDGCLSFGEHFTNTAKTAIVCHDKISIGDNVLVSWDTLIMDTDFHSTENTTTGTVNRHKSPIVIEDNVWIGARTTILKGSVIPEGCIIGASSVVTKAFHQGQCLIAGNPACIKKENITICR